MVEQVDKAFNHEIRKSLNPNYVPKFPSQYTYEQAKNIKDSFCCTLDGYEYWHEGEKLNNARYARTSRLRSRIINLLTAPCVFVTLTFTDKVLDTTSYKTRRKYVARYLKSLGVPYVANYDTGEKRGREHYHGIVQLYKINVEALHEWLDNYGNIDVERIVNPHSKRLARYISKLTNHAIKDTCKQCRVIYSRDVKK